MDSVFRSAREKLEKEHRESKETGKLILERQKKDKEAKERQRRAVEASHRAKRLETIESLMNKELSLVEMQSQVALAASRRARRFESIEEVKESLRKIYYKRIGDGVEAIPTPPWMKTNIPQKRDYDVCEWQVGDAPGTGLFNRKKKKTTDVEKKTKKQMED